MSTTVDQRVVEMRFDNRQFEKNVSTTMSTLDKLKQKLNFKGAADSLENVNAAAKKVNMNGLNNAVDTVHAKFSALQVMGVTALANITNSAVNAGKKIVSALTIDPVKSGFREYETQIGAVQTILANTQHEGKTIEDVNRALRELNTYADQTIYNFTEMTRNIGTFTAAGVKLDTSVSAIKGIANLAAVSGSTSQQASTAMYQLSQALAAGKVSLMDWNSVVNAGMGGKVFQDALTRTARVMGTGVDADIAKYGSFRESLSRGGWLTTEVLTETLEQFTMSAKEGSEEWNNFMASLQKKGYTKEQATEILKMANNASDAATKIKTFTQLWDVMKETAQSGWSQTWQLIFGDFDQAKELFSRLSKPILDFIEGMGKARNDILNSAFSKNFKGLVDSIQNVAKPAKEAMKSIEDLGKIVDKVINGDFGNGKKRLDELTKQGINYYRVQNKVNEKLGNSFRYTEKQIEAQDKLLGKQKSSTKATKEQSEATAEYIADLTELTDAQLKELGYNEKQIESIRELTKLSKKLGIPVKELIENIDKIDGRWLFIESFANIGKSFVTVAKSIGQAWKDIFPSSVEDKGNALFNIIAGMHRISRKFLDSTKDNADELTRTLKGVFAIVDILATILGGGLKIAIKIVSGLLSAFNLNILDVTAYIGDALVGLRDFIDGALDFTDIFKKMKPYLLIFGKAVKDAFVKSLPYLKQFGSFLKDKLAAAIPYLKKFAIYIKDAFITAVPYIKAFATAVKNGFVALKNSKFAQIAKDCLLGFKNGLVSGVKGLWEFIKGIATKVIDTFSEMLGVQSPSWKFFAIAGFCIAGFLNGLIASEGNVWEALKAFGQKCIDIITGIDIGSVVALIVSSGIAIAVVKISNAIESIGNAFGGFAEIADSVSDAFDNLGKVFKSTSGLLKAKALKEVAISILILAGAIAVLALIPEDRLWPAIGALAVIAVIVGALLGLVAVIAKFSAEANTKGVKNSGKAMVTIGTVALAMLGLAASLVLIAFAMKTAAGIDWENGKAGLIALGGAFAAMAVVLIVVSKLGGKIGVSDIDKAGIMMLKMSFAMLIMVGVLKLATGIDWKNGKAGIIALGVFLAAMGGIIILYGAFAKFNGSMNIDAVGSTLLKMAASLLIIALVVKVASRMSPDEIKKAGVILAGALLFIWGTLELFSRIKPNECANVGSTLLAISGAIAILALTMKLISGMSGGEIFKAASGIAALGIVVAGLIFVTKYGGNELKGIGATMIMVAGAIAILAGISVVLGYVKPEKLLVGIAAVTALAIIMGGLIYVTKYAQDCKGNLVAMTVAIGILAVSVAALSFIDPNKLAGAVTALTIIMGMFAMMIMATGQAKSCMGNLIVMTVAIGVIAAVIYILANNVPWQEGLAAAVGIGVLLLAMSASLMLLSKVGQNVVGALAGVAAMVALSLAIVVLANAFTVMGGIGWEGILSALVGIAGAFLIIGVAAFALQGVIPAIFALAAAFILIGGGVLIAAVGLQQMAIAITMLVDAAKVGAPVIATAFQALLMAIMMTIPLLMTTITLAITSFCAMIIQVAPAVAAAVVVLITSVITAITEMIPVLVELGVTIITSFLEAACTVIPKIVELGVTIIIALLDGVEKVVPKIIQTGTSIILALLDGIAKIVPKLIEAGFKIILAFINGMAECIDANNTAVISAVNRLMTAIIRAVKEWFSTAAEKGGELVGKLGEGIKGAVSKVTDAAGELLTAIAKKIKDGYEDLKQAGKDALAGFVQGIKDKVEDVKTAAADLGKKALDSIKGWLGIKSPSREFAKVGRYADEGLVVGLTKYSKAVSAAASDVGNSAMTGLKDSMRDMSSMIASDIESQPTIRPVVDLTDVRNSSGIISDMFNGTHHLNAVAAAGSIGYSMNHRIQNGNGEVISAINKLRDGMSNLGNTTNIVNGVTYDDGSNISDTVKALIRQARIERRV